MGYLKSLFHKHDYRGYIQEHVMIFRCMDCGHEHPTHVMVVGMTHDEVNELRWKYAKK